MADYAIISLGGKQYRVREGEKLLVDRVKADEGKTFHPDLLFVGGGNDDLFYQPNGFWGRLATFVQLFQIMTSPAAASPSGARTRPPPKRRGTPATCVSIRKSGNSSGDA